MSEKKYITNTFQKGLYMDATYNSQPPGTYKYAFNAVNRDFESLNELSNEHSDRLCVEFNNPIVGIGYIDERDRFVVFTKDGLFLVNVNDCSQEFIADDDEFECNWNLDTDKWITPQFKTIDPCAETFVYWSSGCEYYKLNIDEMLSPERKNALKESMKPVKNQCSDITCEYFKVFKLSCQPRLSPVAYKTGGGGLLAGAYQFSVRLVNNEGTPTNWFTVTDPVYIGGEHNEAGEVTNGYIDINMSALDCNFDYGELAVISTIGGVPTAKLIGRFNYVNGRYNYTYMGPEGDPIAIDEIITKGKTYLQGQDMIQYNGNMLYFNIRQEKNLNYQRQANEITVNWNKYRIPYNIVKKYNLKTYMRGESYHFGIKWNSSDGRSSRVFHIPAMGATGGGNNSSSISATETISSDAIVIPTGQGQYKRDRSPNPDTIRDPQFDQFDTNLQAQAESIETEITDIEQALNDCEDCPPAADAAAVDIPKIDEVGADVGSLLGDYGVDELNVDYSASTIKGSITNLFDSVKNRERTEYIPRTVVIDKGAFIGMPSGSEDSSDSSFFSGLMFDTNGKTEIEFPVYRESLGRTNVDFEEDILYPDQKDCTGGYIYGDLANTRVRKHQVPWTSQVQHFVSNSRGVPSEATPDADEYQDAYIDLIGPAFGNIIFPTEEELGFKLCQNNPYTICQVERTSKNKTIHSKGILTNTLESSNDGKSYLYPAHGLNSQDSTVNRYINIDGSRLDAGATFGNNFNFWSLDSMVKAHALNVSHIRLEGLMSGIGNRHGLYATGEEPADSMYGSRIDQRGTRQAINLHKFVKMNENMPLVPLDYKTYAAANEVISPPLGATTPLMNKYQQESIWLGANLEGFILTDKSFKGDVMDHSAPITYGGAFYAALVRNLPNQYGDLTNMPYKPILEAGQVHGENIEGLCGDTFIGPHSFVRTSYVSDKVGNYFPIANMVPGKAERCVCDSPEDVIHSLSGKWIPSTLPIENDYADAKNWAGLHTDAISHSSADVQQRAPVSDYYFPKTLTTLITYWGEFEVNPHMRQRGDTLDEQVYKPLKAEFGLDSSIDSSTGIGWKDDFLNQFHWLVEQPSQWKILKKTLIKTILAILAPVFGLDYIIDGSSTPEFIESLGLGAVVIGVWLMMLKVLFSNKKIDELFGIPECLIDDEGGDKDLHIANFFQNFNKANSDFSLQNKIEVFYGIPVPYYTCDCSECLSWDTEIIMGDLSKKQIKDISVNDLVLSYDFNKNEYINKPILNVWNKGTQDVYRITFRNGTYVDATLNHKWFVRKGSSSKTVHIVTTENLISNLKEKHGKYNLIYTNDVPLSNWDIMNSDEAYILGMYIAEGSQPHNNPKWEPKFFISQLIPENRIKIKNALEKCNFIWKEHSKGFYLSDVGDLTDIFINVGKGSYNKRIPNEVFKLRKDLLEKLYEGLIDGDGSSLKPKVDKNGYSISSRDVYYSSSENLIHDMGILSRLINKPGNIYSSIRSGFGSTKLQYRLDISNNNKVKKSGRLHIKSIEYLDKTATFDIEVQDTNAFILANSGVLSHNCNESTTDEIYISDEQQQGSQLDAYGVIRPHNKINIPSSFGKLTDLFIESANLYAHTTDQIIPLQYGRVAQPTSIGEIILGAGSIIAKPIGMAEGTFEGFAGLMSRQHAINTQYGRFFIDYKAKKLYQFRNGIKELSNIGTYSHFRNKLWYQEDGDVPNEHINPNDLALGIDPRLERLLLTKRAINKEQSWTMSFDILQQHWVSFHEYIPHFYAWDRAHMISSDGKGLYIHDVRNKFQTYRGKYSPYVLEFVINDADIINEIFSGALLETFAVATGGEGEYNLLDRYVTFNKVWMRNNYQSSGYLDFYPITTLNGENENTENKISDNPHININKVNGHWRYHQMYDLAADRHSPLYQLNDPYGVHISPINVNSVIGEKDTTSFKNNIHLNNYLTVRLVFDNFDEYKLYTRSHTILTKKDREFYG